MVLDDHPLAGFWTWVLCWRPDGNLLVHHKAEVTCAPKKPDAAAGMSQENVEAKRNLHQTAATWSQFHCVNSR
jgi:hypothetical protein